MWRKAILNSFIFMWFRKLVHAAENKYNRFLTLLILVYLLAPFLVDSPIGSFTVLIIFLAALIIIVYQIQRSKWAKMYYVGSVVFALFLQGLSYFSFTSTAFDHLFELISAVILLIFLAFSIYLIMRELIYAEQVTADIVKGGICVYFLLGFFWTSVYEIVYTFDTSSFNALTHTITRSDLNHFSFTTLTTVGYGDISPASKIARVLANLEGMVGVMYPAVFIARLVSLQSSR